jgi:hypothetical protein
VKSASDDNASLLKSLRSSGIAPGVRLRVRKRDQENDHLVIGGRSTRVLNLLDDATAAIRINPPH